MTVQLAFTDGCPNLPAAREALVRCMVALGLEPRFEELESDAWASPTILVDGRDVTGAHPPGPGCRVDPLPDDATITGALSRAIEGGDGR